MNNENQKTWDSIAKSFDKTRTKAWPQCIDFINNIESSSTLVDIACGNGRHLIPAAKKCKRVTGVDISNELLKIVKKKLIEQKIDNADLVHSNILELKLDKDHFDYALFIAALHNIKFRENRVKALKIINEILKNNGKALISVWSRNQEKFKKSLKENFDGKIEEGDIQIFWRQDKLNIPRFYHLYKKEELLEDIKKSGLILLDIKEEKLSSKTEIDNYFAYVKKN